MSIQHVLTEGFAGKAEWLASSSSKQHLKGHTETNHKARTGPPHFLLYLRGPDGCHKHSQLPASPLNCWQEQVHLPEPCSSTHQHHPRCTPAQLPGRRVRSAASVELKLPIPGWAWLTCSYTEDFAKTPAQQAQNQLRRPFLRCRACRAH